MHKVFLFFLFNRVGMPYYVLSTRITFIFVRYRKICTSRGTLELAVLLR